MGAVVDYNGKINVKTINPINVNDGIDTIYITAAGYVNQPFHCATPDSALGWEEPVWNAELTRSTNLVMTNILEVDYGLVARIEITYAYMNIEDYKKLCKIAKERVCNITYFNREKAEWVINQEFAFTSQSLKKLYAFGSFYFGALDISITLVATNRDRVDIINTDFKIKYDLNGGTGTLSQLGKEVGDKYNYKTTAKWGENATIVTSDGISYSGKNFKCWNTSQDGSGGTYFPNQQKTIWEDVQLYAQWE